MRRASEVRVPEPHVGRVKRKSGLTVEIRSLESGPSAIESPRGSSGLSYP